MFSDGLVIVVGSGLSCAEGLPGMSQLAARLTAEVPNRLPPGDVAEWSNIAAQLSMTDLESVLLKHPASEAVAEQITRVTAEYIREREAQVIGEILAGSRRLRFNQLIPHLLRPSTGIPVITTNYDRLLEVAAETGGLGVDTLFSGHYFGRLNPNSKRAFCRGQIRSGRTVVHQTAEHITLLKPHGSLDWFVDTEGPLRSSLAMAGDPLIITPGGNKFRKGYDRPFDAHRDRANREIDRGDRFLIVGYGFNDDHLQTHLTPRLRTKPAAILSYSLTAGARAIIRESPLAIGLSHRAGGTVVTTIDSETFVAGSNMWDLGKFVTEVLENG